MEGIIGWGVDINGIAILNNTGEYSNVKWLVKIIPNKKYGKFYWVSDTRK